MLSTPLHSDMAAVLTCVSVPDSLLPYHRYVCGADCMCVGMAAAVLTVGVSVWRLRC